MANPHRGEIELTLGAKRRTLRPTFEALAEIESRTGLTMGELAGRALTGELGVAHVAVIVWAGIRAVEGDEAPTLLEVGEAVVSDGYSSFLVGGGDAQGLVDFLKLALGWSGDDPPAEKKSRSARPKRVNGSRA